MNNILFRKVNASTLSYFRIVLGFLALYIFLDWRIYVIDYLATSKYFLSYDGFHWVKPMSPELLNILFYVLIGCAIMLIIGLYYRVFSVLVFLGYTYLFLLDRGHYNNHYYLYSMLFFFLTIVDANKLYSIDRLIKKDTDNTVFYWQVLLIKIQLIIVYFYGGIAKINLDWFMGFPLRFWLYDNSVDYAEWFGLFLRTKFAAIFYSYSGLIFDLSMGFLLFYKRTRRIAILPVIFFHVSNHFFWNIGSFPWVMLLSTMIFFEPDTVDKLIKNIKTLNYKKIVTFIENLSFKKIRDFFLKPLLSKKTKKETVKLKLPRRTKMRLVQGFLVIWFVFQLLFPLRRFAYSNYASWSGQGHLFAWRMMLLDTVDAFRIRVEIPDDNVVFYVDVLEYVNQRQFAKIRREPMQLLAFVKFIQKELKEKGGVENPVIKLEVWKSVNERTPQLLNDTTLNYALVEYQPLKSASWINDWKPTDELPTFDIVKYAKWKDFLETLEQDHLE